jgi:hypothetical protein
MAGRGWTPGYQPPARLLLFGGCTQAAAPVYNCAASLTLPFKRANFHPLPQVLFQDGRFQWDRLENLLRLAKEGTGAAPGTNGGLDLSSTVSDGARVREEASDIFSFVWLFRAVVVLQAAWWMSCTMWCLAPTLQTVQGFHGWMSTLVCC